METACEGKGGSRVADARLSAISGPTAFRALNNAQRVTAPTTQRMRLVAEALSSNPTLLDGRSLTASRDPA